MNPRTIGPMRAHACSTATSIVAISCRGEPVARDLSRVGAGSLGGSRGRVPRQPLWSDTEYTERPSRKSQNQFA